MVRKVQFKNVAIYSSINNQKVNSIADQVIEILSNFTDWVKEKIKRIFFKFTFPKYSVTL